jgi:hypothetical protein
MQLTIATRPLSVTAASSCSDRHWFKCRFTLLVSMRFDHEVGPQPPPPSKSCHKAHMLRGRAQQQTSISLQQPTSQPPRCKPMQCCQCSTRGCENQQACRRLSHESDTAPHQQQGAAADTQTAPQPQHSFFWVTRGGGLPPAGHTAIRRARLPGAPGKASPARYA